MVLDIVASLIRVQQFSGEEGEWERLEVGYSEQKVLHKKAEEPWTQALQFPSVGDFRLLQNAPSTPELSSSSGKMLWPFPDAWGRGEAAQTSSSTPHPHPSTPTHNPGFILACFGAS